MKKKKYAASKMCSNSSQFKNNWA